MNKLYLIPLALFLSNQTVVTLNMLEEKAKESFALMKEELPVHKESFIRHHKAYETALKYLFAAYEQAKALKIQECKAAHQELNEDQKKVVAHIRDAQKRLDEAEKGLKAAMSEGFWRVNQTSDATYRYLLDICPD